MTVVSAPLYPHPRLIARLRSDLRAANWTVATVEDRLSVMALAAMDRDQLVPAIVEMAARDDPADVLTRLFVLAQPVPSALVEGAFPTLGIGGAQELGILTEDAEAADDHQRVCAATVDLRPHAASLPLVVKKKGRGASQEGESYEDGEGVLPGVEEGKATGELGELEEHHWWVASDLSQAQTGLAPREDHVLGIASASTNLLRLTVRHPVKSALDLGCGCGIVALYLATHAKRVVATDISERACQFTRFNALLNHADIEVRRGSLYEPVEGERFDLITSNPPFVITPDSVRARLHLEYRDGGMARDTLLRLVVEEGALHLAPNGTLQMLANWEVGPDSGKWAQRPTEWIEGAVGALARAEEEKGGEGERVEESGILLAQTEKEQRIKETEEGAQTEWVEEADSERISVEAWVVQRDLIDVAQYAEWWLRDAGGERVDRERWNAEYREWITDFHKVGTTHIGLGSITLRVRRDLVPRGASTEESGRSGLLPAGSAKGSPDIPATSGAHDLRSGGASTEKSTPAHTSPSSSVSAGSDLPALTPRSPVRVTLVCEYLPDGPPVDGVAVQVALDALRMPQKWRDRPLRRTDDVREERYYVPGSADPELVRVAQGRAGGRTRTVSSAVAALIGVADGELSANQVVPAIAHLLGRETDEIWTEIEEIMPELLRSGTLVLL